MVDSVDLLLVCFDSLLFTQVSIISDHFEHVEFPSPLSLQNNVFSLGVDFWVLIGEPFDCGDFV